MSKKTFIIVSALTLSSTQLLSQNFVGINNQFLFDLQSYRKHVYYTPGFLFEKKFNKYFSLISGFEVYVVHDKYKCSGCPNFGNATQQYSDVGYYDSNDWYVWLIVPLSIRHYIGRNPRNKIKSFFGYGLEANFSVYEKHTGSYFKINGNVIDPGPYHFHNHRGIGKSSYNGILFNINGGAGYEIKKKIRIDVNPFIVFPIIDNHFKVISFGYPGLNVACFYKLN